MLKSCYIIFIFSSADNIDKTDHNKQCVDENIKDKDYEQVDEVDDEATMEEEEALPELEDPMREIRFLEEVLNIYIYSIL